MLKNAKMMMDELNCDFIVTGEVLNQRGKSQNMNALNIIERESCLDGLILRPLSAHLLKETIPEKLGMVNRKILLGISGKRRCIQMNLIKKYDIKECACPSGGCLLTYREFAAKVRDLLQHRDKIYLKDISLLKVGRHFRYKKCKIIVGRNADENEKMLSLKNEKDVVMRALNVPSPITLLQDVVDSESIKIAAMLTARYSDEDMVSVEYRGRNFSGSINISSIDGEFLNKIRIKW